MSQEIADPSLYRAFSAALEGGLREAARLQAEGKHPSTRREWPSLHSPLNCGMPSFGFSLGLFDGPPDYSSLLPDIATCKASFAWYREFFEFCLAHARVQQFYQLHQNDQYQFSEVQILVLLGQFIDTYVHTNGSFDYDETTARNLYLGWEGLLLSKSLHLAALVPILFVRCDLDDFQLSPDTSIIRLSERQQLSRMAYFDYVPSASYYQRLVAGAATHAFVSIGWELEMPDTYHELSDVLHAPSAFPATKIDNFFCALRVAASVDTGYSQLIWVPRGWAFRLKGGLLPWMPVLVRRYPAHFEAGYWARDEIPYLGVEDAERVRQVFIGLEAGDRKEIRLATRRINLAALREDEEDAVIDVCVALEALLSDDSAQEMTHKLALRMAALSRLMGYYKTPATVFREVKHIYSYRSAIVHGSVKANDKREIVLPSQERIPTVLAAGEYARLALRALIEHPEYRDPKRIDAELLLGEVALP